LSISLFKKVENYHYFGQGRPQDFTQKGARFFGTKLFQELGTNLKKKDQHSRKREQTLEKKVQNSRKSNKAQVKMNKLKKKGTKLQAHGGDSRPLAPHPLWPPLISALILIKV